MAPLWAPRMGVAAWQHPQGVPAGICMPLTQVGGKLQCPSARPAAGCVSAFAVCGRSATCLGSASRSVCTELWGLKSSAVFAWLFFPALLCCVQAVV